MGFVFFAIVLRGKKERTIEDKDNVRVGKGYLRRGRKGDLRLMWTEQL